MGGCVYFDINWCTYLLHVGLKIYDIHVKIYERLSIVDYGWFITILPWNARGLFTLYKWTKVLRKNYIQLS